VWLSEIEAWRNKVGTERIEAIETLEKLHSRLSKYAIAAKIKQRRLELILIVISAVTTGTLWTLIAGVAQHVTAWGGAILSTIVTALTAYKRSLGPEEVYQRAAELYKKTGELLADVRSSDSFDGKSFWHAYKFI